MRLAAMAVVLAIILDAAGTVLQHRATSRLDAATTRYEFIQSAIVTARRNAMRHQADGLGAVFVDTIPTN